MQPIPPSTLKLVEQIDAVGKAQGPSIKLERLLDLLIDEINTVLSCIFIHPDSYFASLAQMVEKQPDLMDMDEGRKTVTWLRNTASILPALRQLNQDGFICNSLNHSYPPVKIFTDYGQSSLPEFLAKKYQDGDYTTRSPDVLFPSLFQEISGAEMDGKKEFSDPVLQYAENVLPKEKMAETDSSIMELSSLIRVEPGRWDTEVVVRFKFCLDGSEKFVRLPNRKSDIVEFGQDLRRFSRSVHPENLPDNQLHHVFHIEDNLHDSFKGIYALWSKTFQRVNLVSREYSLTAEVYPQQLEIGFNALKTMTNAFSLEGKEMITKKAALATFLKFRDDLFPIFYKQIENVLKAKDLSHEGETRRIQKRDKADKGSSTIWGHETKKYIVLSRKVFIPKSEGAMKKIHLAFRVDDLRTILLGECYIWMTLNTYLVTGFKPPVEQPESLIFNEILNQKLTDSYLLQPIFVVNGTSPNSPHKLGIMTEYCNAGIFEEQYLEKYNLGLKERIELFMQLLKAVSVLHEKLHYYHCDIKEENVLLKWVGNKIQVRLADFGLSQRIGSKYRSIGTKYRMPPEILLANYKGDLPYTASVDVYALGHLLLNVLLERPAPVLYTDETEFNNMMSDKPNFSGLSGDCLDRQLYRLTHRMLDRDPEKRPTLVELEKSFQEIYKDEDEILATQKMIDQLAKQSTSVIREKS